MKGEYITVRDITCGLCENNLSGIEKKSVGGFRVTRLATKKWTSD